MANQWEKVNPDGGVDLLPMPYCLVDEVMDDIFEAVGETIEEIESKKRSPKYEFKLPHAGPTSYMRLPGRIHCAYVEPRGTARMALGTGQGEAILVDTKLRQIMTQAHAFDESEAVTCISICSDSSFQDVPAGPGIEEPPLSSPPVKLFVAGVFTPKILVYDVVKETLGLRLKPACSIQVPKPEEEVERPLVEQLHTRGVAGGIWVIALLHDRSVRAYLCPLGEPPSQEAEDGQGIMLDKPIEEGDEDEEEEGVGGAGGGGHGQEFNDVPQVSTPVYTWSLAQLAPMPGITQVPELESITLTLFSPRPQGGAFGRGVSAGQIPTLCFASSTESSAVLAHSLTSPAPVAAPIGVDLDTLLMQAAPKPGLHEEPKWTTRLQPRRRWCLPAKTSTVAVSPNGGIFAIGGSQGSLALVNTATGPSLRTMLPGHYGAVNSLSFHRDKVLVSIGADCWVHHYDLTTDTLLARHLAGSPLEPGVANPTPILHIAASQAMPLGATMDAEGSLRLLDLKHGCKIARMSCSSEKQEDVEGPQPSEDDKPMLLLSTATGFCVICMADVDRSMVLPGEAADAGDEEAEAPEGEGEDGNEMQASMVQDDQSWLVFFEQTGVLKKLFPTLAAKGGDIAKHFNALSEEDLGKLQPQGVPSTLEKAVVLSAKQPPPDPVAVRAAQLAAAAAARAELASSGSRRRSQQLPDNLIAKLTTENLRRFAAGQQSAKEAAQPSATGAKKMASSLGGSGAFGKSATLNTAAREEQENMQSKTPHVVPKNWQVALKKQLRSGLAGKQTRQSRLQRRLEQMRKEISGD
eukprot:TRINITY_DN27546_c0_g2_i1.p1 TRINITY_DN27546_c0_g2~~TRINITY_DN27546_c0_g2_i1.p1  ORF type:complete len:804 (-),score=151.48 TRINITY_DN27546_c0_g2_i1:67-2478(-)